MQSKFDITSNISDLLILLTAGYSQSGRQVQSLIGADEATISRIKNARQSTTPQMLAAAKFAKSEVESALHQAATEAAQRIGISLEEFMTCCVAHAAAAVEMKLIAEKNKSEAKMPSSKPDRAASEILKKATKA